jgi:AcrR family transcriptional regulator
MHKRQQILDAAERVLRSKGLARTTTREIAREVGCAEGTLYVHFDDRIALFLALLEQNLPGFLEPLQALEQQVVRGSVRANLEAVLHGALEFQNRMLPMIASLFAEPELLAAHGDVLRRRNMGPHRSLAAVEDYIRAEREIGRVARHCEPRAAAFMLLGACFYRTFVDHLMGDSYAPPRHRFVKDVVNSLNLGRLPKPQDFPPERADAEP